MLETFRSQIQGVYSNWSLSLQNVSFSSIGTNISCFRSLLYLSSHKFPSDSPFQVSSTQSFPTVSTWLYPLFYTPSFSLFRSTTIPSSSPMKSHRDFISTQFVFFVQNDNNLILAVNNWIINPLFSAPELSLHYNSSLCDS